MADDGAQPRRRRRTTVCKDENTDSRQVFLSATSILALPWRGAAKAPARDRTCSNSSSTNSTCTPCGRQCGMEPHSRSQRIAGSSTGTARNRWAPMLIARSVLRLTFLRRPRATRRALPDSDASQWQTERTLRRGLVGPGCRPRCYVIRLRRLLYFCSAW